MARRVRTRTLSLVCVLRSLLGWQLAAGPHKPCEELRSDDEVALRALQRDAEVKTLSA